MKITLTLFILFVSAVYDTAAAGSLYRCLEGAWKLDAGASKNSDAMYSMQGHSWVERKTLASISITQIITVSKEQVTIKAVTPIMTKTHTFFLDGKPRITKNLKGQDITLTCYPAKEGGIYMVTAEPGGLKTVTRRYCSPDGKKMINSIRLYSKAGKTVHAVRVFNRVR